MFSPTKHSTHFIKKTFTTVLSVLNDVIHMFPFLSCLLWVLLPLSGSLISVHLLNPEKVLAHCSLLHGVFLLSFLTVTRKLLDLGWRPHRVGIFHTTPRVLEKNGGLLLMPSLAYSWLSKNIQASGKHPFLPFYNISLEGRFSAALV